VALVEEELGLSLSGARLRLGVSRGHLLEVVVGLPLDTEASPEDAQVAAELYLEHCLGEEILDHWVEHVDVIRTPRRRGLLFAEDSRKAAETHPLSLTPELFERALRLIGQERLGVQELRTSAGWTALTLEVETGRSLQPERAFAVTCLPELYKAAFDDLPLSARRFLPEPLELATFVLPAFELSAGERSRRKEALEARLLQELQEGAFVGFGASLTEDYCEVVLPFAEAPLRKCLQLLLSLCPAAELGFFASDLRDERYGG